MLISGATGLVGGALASALQGRGDDVRVLSRTAGDGRFLWNPAADQLDTVALQGCDAVIHLAGRSVLTRWTRTAKQAMWTSRVRGGELLSAAIAAMPDPPRVFITSSAVGIYGSRGDEVLSETSSVGTGFLADLGVAWEGSLAAARERGVRVAAVRSGLVLRSLVSRMRLPFQLGLGARLGNGAQWMSWIRLEDLVALYLRVLDDQELSGPINAVAPNPVTNADFTRALAGELQRPAVLAVPAFVLRQLAGREFAEETVLASQRVLPERLEAARFEFRWPHLAPALRDLLRG